MTDNPPVADTPVRAPPSRAEVVKSFIGDLARPFAIIVTSAATAAATVIVALKVDSFDSAAIFIAAVYAGVGALYGAKAWEAVQTTKQGASVEIAKATSSPPQG